MPRQKYLKRVEELAVGVHAAAAFADVKQRVALVRAEARARHGARRRVHQQQRSPEKMTPKNRAKNINKSEPLKGAALEVEKRIKATISRTGTSKCFR